MTIQQKEKVEKMQAQYLPAQKTKLDELKAMDKKVRRPAKAFAYIFGGVGSLVLGTGMCLAMKVIGNIMPVGIAVGVVGIIMVSVNYALYKKLLKQRKSKYAEEVLALSNEILGE